MTMSNNFKNIAILIADIEEYKHIEVTLGNCAKRDDFHGLLSHTVDFEIKSGLISLRTICFGIGKVNAALAAAFVTDGFDLIVNTGLSGGFNGVNKYDLIVGTSFVEHDFDLTPIGYKRGQKPNEEVFASADNSLINDVLTKFPFVKAGIFATGDCFVCSKQQHDMIADEFSPIACDMESAVIARISNKYNIPYISLRMVSDGADDDSAQTYSDTLTGDRANGWLNVTLDWIKSL